MINSSAKSGSIIVTTPRFTKIPTMNNDLDADGIKIAQDNFDFIRQI